MLTLPDPDLVLWDRFHSGVLSAREQAEHPTLARWARARALGVQAAWTPAAIERLDGVALRERRERAAPILSRAEELLGAAVAELNRRGYALLLADDEGVILASRGAELFSDPAVRAGLSEGARWNEAEQGTNAIGTALAEQTPVAVLGRAHYARSAHGLACYAAPILDPWGRPAGVLDITGPAAAADPLLGILVQSLAATVESVLRAQTPIEAEQRSRGRVVSASHPAFSSLLGDDPRLVEARLRAEAFARSSLPILLRAETGTGKELMARAIHDASDRARAPFVAVNCGGMPEGLLQSELFGFAPGAFTGAHPRGSTGKMGAADGGTLFLDEIAEMSPALQATLLRVLESGVYFRLGDPQERRANLRLVCATWRDLAQLVREGRFRQDLFFRIQGVEITLPPVRERRDLPLLARGLLDRLAEEAGLRSPPILSDAAVAVLGRRKWPGNIRELRTALQYGLVLAGEGGTLEPQHLPPAPLDGPPATTGAAQDRRGAEREALRRALERAEGNLSLAARELGVARSTLYRMMKRHGLDGPGH